MPIIAALNANIAVAEEAARGLEEIVVTARRTEESLQSVPVTVKAFDAEEIRKRGFSTMADIQRATPGISLAGSGSSTNPTYQIRGQSKALSASSTMAPGVVTYFGEVPEPVVGSFIPQYDLSSIQVLKGPQGTLFGRNTIGGAILFEPERPSHEGLAGHLDVSAGNYGARKYEAAINLPIVQDTLALRLAGLVEKRDGYTHDLGFDRKLDDVDRSGFRASLLWTPTDGISNTLVYDHAKSDYNGDAVVAVEHLPGALLPSIFGVDASLGAAIAAQNARGPWDVVSTRRTFVNAEKVMVNNRTEIEFGDVTLVNIFGYRDVELNNFNVEGLPLLVADGSGVLPAGVPIEFIKSEFRAEMEQFSAELQLKGDAFSDKLDWQVGAFWLELKPTGPRAEWVAFGALPGTAGRPTVYNFTTEESLGFYAHGVYDLGAFLEGLEFEAGIRYTEDDIESCTGTGIDSSTGVELDACENADTSQIVGATINGAKPDETTWSVGLNWQINPDHFAYAVSRHGYRAGGINSPTFSGRLAEFQAFEPETVTDYEIGLRSEWTIGEVALRTNISAFLLHGEDVQAPLGGISTSLAACQNYAVANPGVPVPPPLSPDGSCTPSDDPAGQTLMLNMGDSEISGTDVELTIVPGDNLTIHLAGSYLNAETETINRPAALAPYMAGVNGIRFEFVAEKTATASFTYLIPVGSDVLQNIAVRGDYYWTDDITFAGSWMLPSYEVTNFRVDLEGVMSPALDVGLWVRNAFDKEYLASGAVSEPSLGFNSGIFGPPRMYGASLRYRF